MRNEENEAMKPSSEHSPHASGPQSSWARSASLAAPGNLNDRRILGLCIATLDQTAASTREGRLAAVRNWAPPQCFRLIYLNRDLKLGFETSFLDEGPPICHQHAEYAQRHSILSYLLGKRW